MLNASHLCLFIWNYAKICPSNLGSPRSLRSWSLRYLDLRFFSFFMDTHIMPLIDSYFRLYQKSFLGSVINKHIALICFVNGIMLPITLTSYLLLFLLSPKYGYTYEPSTISKETLCQLGITTYVIIGANIGTFTIVSTIFSPAYRRTLETKVSVSDEWWVTLLNLVS